MASDVMSLFGLDPNVIQQQRVQGGIDQASRMSADYAIGAAGGGMLGAGINSVFGLQTPDMQQAQSVQDSMQGVDLTTAAGIRQAASQLMMNGNYAQAMTLHAKASEMEASDLAASNTAADREFGEVRDVIVGTKPNPAGYGAPIADKRTVRITLKGEVIDVVTGEDLTSQYKATNEKPKDGDKSVDGVWKNGAWVKDIPLDKEETAVLSEAAKEEIATLEQSKSLVPQDSDIAKTIDLNIQRVKDENQAAKVLTSADDKKKVAYYEARIAKHQKDMKKYQRADGSFTQSAGYGRLLEDMKASMRAIEDITGTEWTPPE